MATQLNGYNTVLAISQDTINNQFYLLFAEGVISSNLNIAYVSSNPALILDATVNAPTVNLVLSPPSPQQVSFDINFNSGTFTYMDYVKDPNNPQTSDVSGWVITLLVNLGKMTIDSANPTGLAVSPSAQAALSSYVGDEVFTVQALFLDFDNVNLAQVTIDAGGQMPPTDPRYPWLLTAVQQLVANMKASGNPYILGFHAASNNPAQTNPQLPALAATRVQFLSNQYSYPAGAPTGDTDDDGLSALCYLAMTGSNPFPYPDDKVPTFVWNPIPSAQVQGRMFIDNGTFNQGYIHDLVLPVIQRALDIDAYWSQSGNSWTIDYKYSDSGHGPKVGTDSGLLDIYGKATIETSCVVALDLTQSIDNRLVYTGSGFFYQRLDLYEQPLDIWTHDCWTSTKLPFTFALTISAGADGTLAVTFVPVKGTPAPDSWRNALVKITDAVAGLFDESVQSQLDALDSTWEGFQASQFSNFTTAATQGFQGLSEQLIMPAPQQFYYSNIALNAENDVVLDVGFKS